MGQQESPTLALALDLLSRPSVTPQDAGCQKVISKRLEALGFRVEPMRFGEVDNLWARLGDQSPLLCFAGHTDVVPSGPLDQWISPPYQPTIRNGQLFARGAADMKGSLAAIITACETFLAHQFRPKGSLALLITSDEEGPSINGTAKVIDRLQKRGEQIDYCLVGEPSSTDRLGDVVKIGRRGSLNGTLRIKGTQGHVAYPQQANNPIHQFAPALAILCQQQWDQGNLDFPPTGFQISNLNAGTGTTNVIPGELTALINFRYSPSVTEKALRAKVEQILQQQRLDFDLAWTSSGKPFLTKKGALLNAVTEAILAVTGYSTTPSTTGGTSDGRFIAPTGAQVVELGPVNKSIHKSNEYVGITELDQLSRIYKKIMDRLLGN